MDEQWQPPWRYPWELDPVAPPPPAPSVERPSPGHRRAAGWAGALGGALLLGGLLATCGPYGPGDPGTLTTAQLPASPTPDRPPAPSPTSPAAPPAAPTPAAAAADSPAVPESASGSRRPRPRSSGSRGTAAGPTVRPDPGTRSPALTPTQPCAAAERLGEWQPGSEQARACRGLYGG